ncbi:hypothetical protein LCGC14_1655160 [marine sediment metagenome]|uniref:Uncharacterized protein n=1 Tax=marine sediment metagenome TaxID=412755 RepID=A0A0F9KBH6_9ZZZZ
MNELIFKDGAEIIVTIGDGGLRVKIPWIEVTKPLSAVDLSRKLKKAPDKPDS